MSHCYVQSICSSASSSYCNNLDDMFGFVCVFNMYLPWDCRWKLALLAKYLFYLTLMNLHMVPDEINL